jgi:hypothetical protein
MILVSSFQRRVFTTEGCMDEWTVRWRRRTVPGSYEIVLKKLFIIRCADVRRYIVGLRIGIGTCDGDFVSWACE